MDADLADTRGCSVSVGDPSPDAPHHYVFVVIVRGHGWTRIWRIHAEVLSGLVIPNLTLRITEYSWLS
ncbi:MAG: hypothetical protein KatS3mg054_1106 [Chloroflexus sp.]|nr:MAG: hypothetical protein KatS3mg054_1106 [Chloroflexus sp.]